MDGEVSATRCFRSGGMATIDQAPVCVKATENKKNSRKVARSKAIAMKLHMSNEGIYRG